MDEPQTLVTRGRELGWVVSSFSQANPLELIRKPPVFRLRFDTAAFYEDLCEVCVNARSKEWGGS